VAIDHYLAHSINTTPEQVIGKTDFDFFPRDLERSASVVTSKVPLRDDNDEVIGIIGIGFDRDRRQRRGEGVRRARWSSAPRSAGHDVLRATAARGCR
jgi:hypothetical protein